MTWLLCKVWNRSLNPQFCMYTSCCTDPHYQRHHYSFPFTCSWYACCIPKSFKHNYIDVFWGFHFSVCLLLWQYIIWHAVDLDDILQSDSIILPVLFLSFLPQLTRDADCQFDRGEICYWKWEIRQFCKVDWVYIESLDGDDVLHSVFTPELKQAFQVLCRQS